MNQPTMVYKYPGDERRRGFKHNGHVFKTLTIDRSELEQILADGWASSPREAYDIATNPQSNMPPTRAELEEKAVELGIDFNKRTKDETLFKKISERIAYSED